MAEEEQAAAIVADEEDVGSEEEEEEEEQSNYDIVESNQPVEGIVQKFLTLDLSRQPVYTQAAVGGASGWVAGFAFSRVGKAVAAALGGSLLLIHMGSKAGYISVDWEKLDKDMKTAQKDIGKKLGGVQNTRQTKSLLKRGSKFLSRNMVAVGGFLGGFFLGAAV